MGRVLIVDDDADSRETLGMVVESWGHEVAQAVDGPTALSAMEWFTPEIVIVDLGLPGMDGVKVVEFIRTMDGYRAFVIALTGWTRPQDREEALRAGCSLFLSKPADLDQLARTLESASARAERRRGS